jgi:predicted AAA+ superfamily ATPase
MIQRHLETHVKKRLEDSPAVLLLGPRQCGKTTLAKAVGGTYFDLEQPADRLRLDVEWETHMRGEDRLILDEAQSWPELFPRLRGAIDADRQRNDRFLLLGSVAPSLTTQVSESLAGRISRLYLDPLGLLEVSAQDADRLWWRGGFPEPFSHHEDLRWQRDYLQALADRDLPEWGLPAKPSTTMRLFHMLGAVHGQTQNLSQLGKSLGLSYHTVGDYLDFLEGAFLIRRLPVFAANIKKRLVKSPKIYWCDSGLLHAVMKVHDFNTLWNQPWVGAGWEGFVIDHIVRRLRMTDRNADVSFFRTSDGKEVDLVVDSHDGITAIEIKLSSSVDAVDIKRLQECADLIGADRRILLSRHEGRIEGDGVICCSLQEFLQEL